MLRNINSTYVTTCTAVLSVTNLAIASAENPTLNTKVYFIANYRKILTNIIYNKHNDCPHLQLPMPLHWRFI